MVQNVNVKKMTKGDMVAEGAYQKKYRSLTEELKQSFTEMSVCRPVWNKNEEMYKRYKAAEQKSGEILLDLAKLWIEISEVGSLLGIKFKDVFNNTVESYSEMYNMIKIG